MRRSLPALFLVAVQPACSKQDSRPPPGPPPAKVERAAAEDPSPSVVLSADAEARLGLATAQVERKRVERRRTLGAQVIVPPGRRIAVCAPLGGQLVAPPGAEPVSAGSPVTKGRVLWLLSPILSPDARARIAEARALAEGEAGAARVEIEAAQMALSRAEQLFKDKAGSARSLEEARSRLLKAQVALQAAEAKQKVLAGAQDPGAEGLSMSIESPIDGTLDALHVAPGQQVAAGASLFEVVSIGTLWVKVPVYSGDAPQVDARKDTAVFPLGADPGVKPTAGKPVAAPPSAEAATATIDLYYEIDNSNQSFRPGERVNVTLPLLGEDESLVVPWAAVLHDIGGNTWVYENVAPRSYARRRVEVRFVSRGEAVLGFGPAPGAKVVTDGAAEILGVESGFAK